MGLFDQIEASQREAVRPLAARLRPQTLAEFCGQSHLLAPGCLLRRLIDTDRVQSVVLFGPPGIGKTTLAMLIATHTRREFRTINAAAAGVKELRDVLDTARALVETAGQKTVLFIDEVHHFNKQQQNVLLPDLEEGVVSLVAATTANPFFALIPALLSRSQVFELKPLSETEIITLLQRALADRHRGLGQTAATVTPEALAFFARICDGDARRALNALELAVLSLPAGQQLVQLADAEASVQKKSLSHDGTGDDHYDVISAFIKSVRGSDPDAAIYWLARLIEAGEEPRFIARRLVILAAEDIGNADPQGLLLAQAAAHAVEMIGMPEGRIPLAQATVYLALAPKSNASYVAINMALDDVRQGRNLPVPNHLRDKSYPGAARLGHGTGYQYPHDAPQGWLAQDYLGAAKTYFTPTDRGVEAMLYRQLQDRKGTIPS